MASPEVMAYAFISVVVNRLICFGRSAVAEVCAPTSQNLIESIPHLRPRLHVVWYQKVSHFLLDTCNALLRRTCTQIPAASLFEAVWTERITQKVKALFARLFDAGLRLIQSEPQSGDHPTRPIQRLCRFPATQNHEIVRVGDHTGLELFSPFGVPPALQQTVHVQVGEQRADDSLNAKDNLHWKAYSRARAPVATNCLILPRSTELESNVES